MPYIKVSTNAHGNLIRHYRNISNTIATENYTVTQKLEMCETKSFPRGRKKTEHF